MTRDDQLADLLVAWDDAIAAGRPITPQDLCRDHPDLLEPFLELLRAVGHINRVFDGPPTDPQQFVERFDAGRYKPRTFHAAGGLGMVAVADDQELKRPVALKVMQQLAALDPAARRRFLLEAEITGKLEHPGVAPVYGAGEDPDGLPYYAMRFIQGKTLADHIREHHTTTDPTAKRLDFARLLRCLASVCQTVAYAHARGVLHRDIKPGNIMLGPYGETLLVDWGLAKQFDLPDPTGSVPIGFKPVDLKSTGETIGGGQTVAGQVKGSPAFMAPEQARGEWDRVGPAADIYALGATLYVLLTGQMPYTGETTEQVIRAVKAGPPRPVVAVRPTAPKPLAAVCAKAMSRTPNERYASAQELAADVERWLADEPVSAYRDPLFTRIRRWVKRHRTLAAAAAAGLLVLTAALAVVAPILTAKNQELAKANGDLNKANTDLTAANAARQEDFEEADAGLFRMAELAHVRSGGGKNDPAIAAQRDTFHRYREYQLRFVTRNGGRPEMRVEVGVAWLKAAEMDYTLNRLTETLTEAEEAERLFAALKRERPNDREAEYGWACARYTRGQVFADRGQISEAEPVLVSAREAFAKLATDPTPLRIARLGSTAGLGHRDSPSFRLAGVTITLAEVRAQAKRAEQLAGVPGRQLPVGEYLTQLKTALTVLTNDKLLPPDTPITTWLAVFGLRLRMAVLDPDEESGMRAMLALSADAQLAAKRFPAAAEFWVVVIEAEAIVGQAEMAQARGLLAALRSATEAGRAAEAKRLETAWEQAFRTAHERMVGVATLAEKLEQADLGLDLTDVLGNALAVQVEVGALMVTVCDEMNQSTDLTNNMTLTLAALKRLTERKRASPEATGRGLAAATTLAGVAYLAAKKGPAKGETDNAHTKRMSSLRADANTVRGYAEALNGRLLELSPNEPRYLFMKAYLAITRADTALEQGEPARLWLDQAEAAVKPLRADASDWYILLLDILLLNARAIHEGIENKNPALAVKLLEQVNDQLAEGEKLGMPGSCVDLFRVMFTTTKAAALRIQAEGLLNGPATGHAEGRQLVTRALALLRDSEKVKVRDTDDPDIKQRLNFVLWRRGQVRAELEKLDTTLNPKK